MPSPAPFPPARAADVDCDAVEDSVDNCPERFNPDQGDLDLDGAGDACNADKDGDCIDNDSDNCVRHDNAGQDDADAAAACDRCGDTPDTEVADRRGCSIDQNCRCDQDDDGNPWRTHSRYVRCVKDEVYDLRQSGRISKEEAEAFRDSARASSCGEQDLTCE